MKMVVKQDAYDVGVIIGRFQVPELHDAHRALIQHVCDEHDKVLIFLGLSPLVVTRENPLDFEARKQMILAAFPNVNVFYIKDVNNNLLWSKRLDEMVKDVVTPSQSVVLYGGRDSFVESYHGSYPVRELEQDVWVSGNELRAAISKRSVKASPDFRAGVVWAAYSQFPTVYTTVDICIFNHDETKILLGRKPHEDLYRFIGGFADPGSYSFEQDARREVQEETGITTTDPIYIGSYLIDDWRYRNEVNKIKTLFFKAKVLHGAPKPNDDIAEVKWFDLASLKITDVVPSHRELVLKVIETQDTDRRVNNEA